VYKQEVKIEPSINTKPKDTWLLGAPHAFLIALPEFEKKKTYFSILNYIIRNIIFLILNYII